MGRADLTRGIVNRGNPRIPPLILRLSSRLRRICDSTSGPSPGFILTLLGEPTARLYHRSKSVECVTYVPEQLLPMSPVCTAIKGEGNGSFRPAPLDSCSAGMTVMTGRVGCYLKWGIISEAKRSRLRMTCSKVRDGKFRNRARCRQPVSDINSSICSLTDSGDPTKIRSCFRLKSK